MAGFGKGNVATLARPPRCVQAARTSELIMISYAVTKLLTISLILPKLNYFSPRPSLRPYQSQTAARQAAARVITPGGGRRDHAQVAQIVRVVIRADSPEVAPLDKMGR